MDIQFLDFDLSQKKYSRRCHRLYTVGDFFIVIQTKLFRHYFIILLLTILYSYGRYSIFLIQIILTLKGYYWVSLRYFSYYFNIYIVYIIM